MPYYHDERHGKQAQGCAENDAAAGLWRPAVVSIILARRLPGIRSPDGGVVVAAGQLVVAERVEHQAGESYGVAECLQYGDLGVPEEDGDDDEKNALEDAGEGHDETRGAANLPDVSVYRS